MGMREIEFAIGKKKVHSFVPECWEEMSEQQFLAIIDMTYNVVDDATFFARFFGINEQLVKELDLYYFYVLNSLLSFTRDTGKLSSFLIRSFILVNKQGRVMTVVAPDAKLAGMSLQQFMMIDTFYTWYQQTQQRKFLLQMCCCCYLQPEEDFFKLVLNERLQYWTFCPETELKAVLVQWSLIKSWLAGAYVHLFPQGEVVEKGRNGKVKVTNTWTEIFDTLVADDLTRIESYKRLDCMDVIRNVNYRIQEGKKQQR